MTRHDARKKLFQSLGACFLAFVMILTNVLGAVEVHAAGIEAPTINKVYYDATSISGGNLHRGTIGGKQARGTVHVTLKDSSGNVKASVSVTPKSGKTWTVNLSDGVTIAEGDTVTAYQEFDGQSSPVTTANAEPSLAYKHKNDLKMPTGEIWIEQTSSNQVNDDEQAEAIEMLKKANPDIAKDFDFGPKKTKFSIDGTDHAYYEITYTDGSSSGKIEATGLKIKTVTETSAAPTIEKVQVTDGQIIVTFANEVAEGTKFYFVSNFTDGEESGFCENGSCKVDKSTSKEMSEAVSIEGKKVTFPINDKVNDLKLGKEFGIVVKEPHKFRSCAKSEPVVTTPAKVEVRDPKKLTDKEKEAIDAAIRKANTVNNVSKLPDGTGDKDGTPAFIEFDKDGNTRIISPNNVEVKWDENYKPVYQKNADGTYKVNDEAKVNKIPAKYLLKNIKPDAPTVALSGDKKNITITPNLKVDTDANSISVSYTGKNGSTKTTKATKADNGTWSISEGEGSVDANGVVTLPKDKVKGGTDVTAKVTDKGGIADDDKDPLTSEPGTLTVEETKADKVEALGGLDPVELKKWVGDEVDWKDGVKAKDDAKKDAVDELLKGAKFEDVTEENRSTSKEGDFEGKIKITFDDKSELVVEKQMLYVSNHVTSMDRKDKVPTDALDVEFKLGEGTKVDNTGSGAIEGNKDNPTSYSKYKVKPNTNLKTYNLPTLNKSVVDAIDVTAQDGYTEPVWKNSQNGDDFVATDSNKVFTATATKTYDITFNANSGTGTKEKETVKKDSVYDLPAANTFTAPENMQFSGWQVGDDTTLKQAGEKITITGDTVVKAIWKPIELKVSFNAGTGASGEMKDAPVNKGSEYELPTPTFKAPENQEFAGWQVPGETEVKQAKEKIKITDNVTLTATWKDIMVNVSYNANGGSGEMEGKELKKGSTYKLLDNKFTAPKNQEFKAWEVDGKEVAAGTEITVDKDTEVKAIWKDKAPAVKEFKVTFNGNGGTDKMDPITVKKGQQFELPKNGFTAPKGKVFAGWQIAQAPNKVFAPGTMVTVNGNIEVKAIWKDITSQDPSQPGNGTFYMGSTLIMPNRAPEPVEPAKEMETGRHYRYLYGYEDKTVRPEGNITRAEAAALIARLAGLDMSDKSKPNFPDTPSRWYNSAINIAVKMDLMFADKDGNFRPNEAITRAEFARALYFVDKKNDKVAPFADVKGHVYEDAINQAYGNGRINGYPDGTFRPDAKIQRAEVARILNQYANRGTTLEGMAGVAKNLIQFTDITPSHWAYCEVMEAANNHEYQREKGTQLETWLRILPLDIKIAEQRRSIFTRVYPEIEIGTINSCRFFYVLLEKIFPTCPVFFPGRLFRLKKYGTIILTKGGALG